MSRRKITIWECWAIFPATIGGDGPTNRYIFALPPRSSTPSSRGKSAIYPLVTRSAGKHPKTRELQETTQTTHLPHFNQSLTANYRRKQLQKHDLDILDRHISAECKTCPNPKITDKDREDWKEESNHARSPDSAGPLREGELSTRTQQVETAGEVSQAIQQVVEVTDQTSAASENMASSSEQLGAQADQLRELVGHFRISG